jgi:hypothetical protein
MTDNPPPATPETLSLPKCPEERKNLPPRKQQYFTFEQVQERAHAARSRAAKVPGCYPCYRPTISWDNCAPMVPEKDDDSDRPAGDAGEPNPT